MSNARPPARARVDQARELAGADDAREFYREWARDYDRDVYGELSFTGGRDIAGLLAAQLDRLDAGILDVGCGTGHVGEELQKLGFTRVDGLDLSPEMLELARGKDVYRELIEADLLQPLDIPDCCYDAVISAGTFATGHISADRLAEIVRLIKPKGWLACVVAESHWTDGGFDRWFEEFAEAGRFVSFEQHSRNISAKASGTARFCVGQII